MNQIKQTRVFYHRFLLLLTVGLVLFGCASTKTTSIQKESPNIVLLKRIISDVKNESNLDGRLTVFNISGAVKNDTLFLTGETTEKKAYSRFLMQVKNQFTIPVKNEIEQLPNLELGADSCALVCVSVANLHPQPNITGEIVNQALMGAKVRLFKKKRGVHLVQLTDGYVGWISNSMLAVGDISLLNKWDSSPKVVVTTFWGLVKEEKDHSSRSIADIVAGDEMVLVKSDSQWTQVKLPDGRQGFVLSDEVMEKNAWLEQAPATVADIIDTAVQLIGIPYQWGGTSIKGMDCSGFTYTVYRMNRIFLPRDAYMQASFGTEIKPTADLGNLEPGDLLYFGKQAERITHAGLYLGNKKFIHEEGIVHINSFNPTDPDYNAYRHRTLRQVRRIIGN